MALYLGALLGGALTTFLLTPAVARLATRLGWVDLPGGRKVHAHPVPRLGGVAVFLGLLVGALAYGAVIGPRALQDLLQHEPLLAFLLPALLVFLTGVVDDTRGLGPAPKVVAEAVAGAFLIQGGYVIDVVTNPLGEPIALGVFAFPLTLCWLILVTNAFNLIDGLDGLLSAVGTLVLLGIAAIAIQGNRAGSATLALALAGSLLGFLPWNWRPARIFLGDSGSLTIGFAIAALSLKVARTTTGNLSFHVPLLLCAVPLFETGLTIARRYVSGQAYYQGDRSHVHHVLLNKGWSVPQAVAGLAGVTGLVTLVAVLCRYWRRSEVLIAILALLALAALALRWLGYVELRVLVQRLRSGAARRRTLPALVALAQAREQIEAARDPDELDRAVVDTLERLGLSTIRLEDGGGRPLAVWPRIEHAAALHPAIVLRVRLSVPPVDNFECAWPTRGDDAQECPGWRDLRDHLALPTARAWAKVSAQAPAG